MFHALAVETDGKRHFPATHHRTQRPKGILNLHTYHHLHVLPYSVHLRHQQLLLKTLIYASDKVSELSGEVTEKSNAPGSCLVSSCGQEQLTVLCVHDLGSGYCLIITDYYRRSTMYIKKYFTLRTFCPFVWWMNGVRKNIMPHYNQPGSKPEQ